METSTQKSIAITEGKRQKKYKENLIKEKESQKQLQMEHRRLGPHHMILASDRKKFKKLILQITGENVLTSLRSRKTLQVPKQNWGKKKLGLKKILRLEKIFGLKFFCLKTIFWLQIFFGLKDI